MTYLVAMKGHPATGKSTLATALASALKWPLLDKDDIKDHVLRLPDNNDLAYAILWQLVATQLRLGVSVIMDSPFAYPTLYAQAKAVTERYDARLLVVETVLDEPLWRQRLEERSPEASAHKIQGWQRMQAQLAHYNGCWRYPIASGDHLLLNTAASVERLVEIVKATLQCENKINEKSL